MINEVMTFTEASQVWGLSDGTLRHATERKVFKEGEIRKSGKVWLVTREAMERVYGEIKED